MDFHSASKMAGSPLAERPRGHHEIHQYLLANIDRRQLRIKSDDDVSLLIRQIVGMFMQTIGYFIHARLKVKR